MYYVLDENNNKVEAYDKEGVLALLEQAIEDGTLEHIVEDSAFVTKLKCCVGGDTHKIGFVTQAKYNELQEDGLLEENAYYFITDDNSVAVIDEALNDLNSAVETINNNIVNIKKNAVVFKSVNLPSLSYLTREIYQNLIRVEYGTTNANHLTEICPCLIGYNVSSSGGWVFFGSYIDERGIRATLNVDSDQIKVYYLETMEA